MAYLQVRNGTGKVREKISGSFSDSFFDKANPTGKKDVVSRGIFRRMYIFEENDLKTARVYRARLPKV